MSLRTKIREQLYELHLYRGGRVPVEGLRGLLQAMENIQGHSVSIPDPKIAFFTAQSSTPSAAILTGPGRLYGIWALSGSLAGGAPTSTLDVIIKMTDNAVAVGSFKVQSNKAAEVYFFDSVDGVGLKFTTDLKVLTNDAATGAGNPAAGDRPDIVVIWGDDTVNTADANLINTNYG